MKLYLPSWLQLSDNSTHYSLNFFFEVKNEPEFLVEKLSMSREFDPVFIRKPDGQFLVGLVESQGETDATHGDISKDKKPSVHMLFVFEVMRWTKKVNIFIQYLIFTLMKHAHRESFEQKKSREVLLSPKKTKRYIVMLLWLLSDLYCTPPLPLSRNPRAEDSFLLWSQFRGLFLGVCSRLNANTGFLWWSSRWKINDVRMLSNN